MAGRSPEQREQPGTRNTLPMHLATALPMRRASGRSSCARGRRTLNDPAPIILLAELEEFVCDQQPHGTLTCNATAPA